MITVCYLKKFVNGNLKGLTYPTVVTFDRLETAEEFADILEKHSIEPVKANFSSDYTCHNVTIVEE